MAKGIPGEVRGQGSFFEVLDDQRTVRLRPEEMNGGYAPAPLKSAPVSSRRRMRRLQPGARPLSKAL